ncbi:DUF1931 family protein [Leifsonia sp. NPDC058248]|uniref:DUF1931 family protein n=1 Tax=Leifsonia sp. NPDC058248 TaxID=3346402 RepID=UPI0036DCE730
MHLFGISKFERFFRMAAGIDIDKNDLRRFDDFVNDKLYDLLLRAVATAKANGRDVVESQDLPITAGLQESMHVFRKIDEEVSLDAILDQLVKRPALDLVYDDETRDQLPQIAGGLGVALARTFRILDESQKTPQPGQWDKATRIFDLLL